MKRRPKALTQPDFFPSGSTSLNLLLSDDAQYGQHVGSVWNTIGDSGAGKSLLELTKLAIMAHMHAFDRYRLCYDDVEHAGLFDLPGMFGKLTERLEEPQNGPSDTVEDFHDSIHWLIEEQEDPFVYILDSFDALTTRKELAKAKKNRALLKAGRAKDVKGDYGMEKAKLASQYLRQLKKPIKKRKSGLGVISQVRDNTDQWSFETVSRSGGRALKFYSRYEIWLFLKDLDTKTVAGKKRRIGVNCNFKVTKNKYNGKKRDGMTPILDGYGVDDIRAMLMWLVEENYAKKPKGGSSITIDELGLKGTVYKVVQELEADPAVLSALVEYTTKCWQDLEDKIAPKRKRKFG